MSDTHADAGLDKFDRGVPAASLRRTSLQGLRAALACSLMLLVAGAASAQQEREGREEPLTEFPERDSQGVPTERNNAEQNKAEKNNAAATVEPEPEDSEPKLDALRNCKDAKPEDETALEKVRRRLTVTACASSAWLDSLFGDQLHYDQYRDTYGSVSLGSLWSEYDGFDPRLRFRARLQLPQWDDRVSAFAGRVGEDAYISDSENEFDALPTRNFGGGVEDESVLLGLGYSNPDRTGNDFDAGVGVRVDLPLDPYARVRYEVVRAFAEHYVFRARETLFWQNTEGLGTTTRFNIDRALTDRLLLRWNNLGKWTEETDGMEWFSEITMYQKLGDRMGLAWQTHAGGATDNEVPLINYGARVIMRRQMTPDWLFLEARAGFGWPRRKLSEDRELSPEAGIAFEMQFGQREN